MKLMIEIFWGVIKKNWHLINGHYQLNDYFFFWVTPKFFMGRLKKFSRQLLVATMTKMF